MPNKNSNTCPRCQKPFKCKADDILNCQCYGITLSVSAQASIKDKFQQNCLCRACLEELNKKTGHS